MVKKTLVICILCISFLKADIYTQNCVACHEQLPVSIDKYFYRYLLKYSSQKDVKKAMIRYLKNPSSEESVMPKAFISRFGVKSKTTLSEARLRNAINIYWKKYEVFGKLK